MSTAHWADSLRTMRACGEAVEWCEPYASLADAWAACDQGDWMLWLAAKTLDRKLVVLAACACARTALVHVPAGELRPLRAIESAEAWARGEATLKDVLAARYDAYASYAATYASYASYAAYASDAAYAAYAAAAAADAADAADAARSLAQSADICRRMLPCPVLP